MRKQRLRVARTCADPSHIFRPLPSVDACFSRRVTHGGALGLILVLFVFAWFNKPFVRPSGIEYLANSVLRLSGMMLGIGKRNLHIQAVNANLLPRRHEHFLHENTMTPHGLVCYGEIDKLCATLEVRNARSSSRGAIPWPMPFCAFPLVHMCTVLQISSSVRSL